MKETRDLTTGDIVMLQGRDGWNPRPALLGEEHVLVALEDSATRARVSRLVESLGLEPISVADGIQLTEVLADSILGDGHQRPSAIVINPVLRGCTGFAVLSGLRDLGWTTPVIFIIDDAGDGRYEPWANGVSGVFIEPFQDNELRDFLDLMIELPATSWRPRDGYDLARSAKLGLSVT